MDSKLLRCIRKLDSSEIRKFEKFLISPYFGVPPKPREFALDWLRLHKKNKWRTIEKENAWGIIFPQKKYIEKNWNKYQTLTFGYLKEFLSVERWYRQKTDLTIPISILQEFDERDLAHEFKLELNEIEKKKVGSQAKYFGSDTAVWEKVRLVATQYNFERKRQDPNKSGEIEVNLLKKREQLFEQFFLLGKLKTSIALENRRWMRKENPVQSLPEGFTEFVRTSLRSHEPLFFLNAMLFQLFGNINSQSTNNFLDRYWQHYDVLSEAERKALFVYPLNISIRAYFETPNVEKAGFLYELYQKGMDHDVMYDMKGKMLGSHFKNICTLSCNLARIKEASVFVNHHAIELIPNVENANIIDYCHALIAFHQGRFRETKTTLLQLDREKYLKLEIRSLEMKCLYELGEQDLLESTMVSYERFLERAANIPEKRVRILRMRMQVVKQVLRIKSEVCSRNEKKEMAMQLERKVSNQDFHDTGWLLKIIKDLK